MVATLRKLLSTLLCLSYLLNLAPPADVWAASPRQDTPPAATSNLFLPQVNGSERPRGSDQGQVGPPETCAIYPIALPAALLEKHSAGSVIAASLTPPGNSAGYINPQNAADSVLNLGDPVSGRTRDLQRCCPARGAGRTH